MRPRGMKQPLRSDERRAAGKSESPGEARGTARAGSAEIATASEGGRQRAALNGSILSTMLILAWPTVIVLVVQTFVGVAETYFVSFLGTDALAGVALVFPVFMLMTMMSNGGIEIGRAHV